MNAILTIIAKRRKKSVVLVSLTMTMLIMLLFARRVHSFERYDVVVVESSAFKTYEDVIAGFKSSCNCNVKKIIPLDLYGKQTIDEIYDLKPRIVFAIGEKALKYLSSINDLPIIYTMVHDPKPLVDDKKNVIGVTTHIPFEKQLSTIAKIFTSVKRLGVMYNPKDSIGTATMNGVLSRASSLGITLTEGKFHNSRDLISAVDKMDGNIDALWLIPDALMTSPELIEYIMLYSIKYNVPVFSFTDKHLDLGASLVITTAPADVGIQAGELASIMVRSGSQPDNLINESNYATVMINKIVVAKMSLVIAESFKNRDTLKLDLTKRN
ncbi:MAG: hypothetical protein HQK89_02460 [Nitrospirae bacterium]|nr:hypothetical protein [Nitrospirota bacterium]